MNPLKGKTILIGVTGGIAAYKVPLYIRELKKRDATVKVILTENAKRFVTEDVISVISDGVYSSLWEDGIPHIDLTRDASLLTIVPADYNIIGKAASGVADDLLSTVIAAYKGSILFFPSMNYRMLENPVLRRNLDILKEYKHHIIASEEGELACDEEGKGRLPSISRLIIETEKTLTPNLLEDSYCLITGGGTSEKIDPVRNISNRSTGKMAYSLARACYLSGGEVELILGESSIIIDAEPPYKIVRVESASQMHDEILKRWKKVDYLFMSAAVSDFKTDMREKKIKRKKELKIKLTENIDILADLKKRKKSQFIVGFSLETQNILKSSKKKMKDKGIDIMIANKISAIGDDKTEGYIISKKDEESFESSKEELAWRIIRKIRS